MNPKIVEGGGASRSAPLSVAINGSGNPARLFGVIPQKLYAMCGVAFVVFQIRFKQALLNFNAP